MKNCKVYCWWLIVIILIAFICLVLHHYRFVIAEKWQTHFGRFGRISRDGANLGTLGDYVGGVFGTLLSLLTVVLLVFNYFVERKKHEDNLASEKQSSKDAAKRFEDQLKQQKDQHIQQMAAQQKAIEEQKAQYYMNLSVEQKKNDETKQVTEYNRCLDIIFRQIEITHQQLAGIEFLANVKGRGPFNHINFGIYTNKQKDHVIVRLFDLNFNSIYHTSEIVMNSLEFVGKIIDESTFLTSAKKNALKALHKKNIHNDILGFYNVLINAANGFHTSSPHLRMIVKACSEFVAATNYAPSSTPPPRTGS